MVTCEAYKWFRELETERDNYAEKIRVAQEHDAFNLKTAEHVWMKVDEFATKVQSLEQNMQDEAVKVATQQTRAEMML